MNQLLTILAVLISAISFGQSASIEAYTNVKGLQLIDTITPQELIGEISWQVGSFSWVRIQLEPNMTYKITSRDCLTMSFVDSGSWNISYKRMLALKSSKSFTLFDILKMDRKYYFVEPKERKHFLADVTNKVPLILNYYTKAVK